ncbi:MAG: hypothetical protein ACL7AX_10075 [Candidatus Arsenophonus phytopathogenicus]
MDVFDNAECGLPQNKIELSPEQKTSQNEAEDEDFNEMVDDILRKFSPESHEEDENVNKDLLKVLAGYIAYRVQKNKNISSTYNYGDKTSYIDLNKD